MRVCVDACVRLIFYLIGCMSFCVCTKGFRALVCLSVCRKGAVCVCVWAGCRPSFRAPADLSNPPPPRNTHTHTQADTHSESIANPLPQPMEGSSVLQRSRIYTCVTMTMKLCPVLTVPPRCHGARWHHF